MTTPTTITERHLLGERLRSWRDGFGLSQREVARAAGIRQPTLSMYEAGLRDNIPLHVAMAYAKATGVSLDLITGKSYEEALRDGDPRLPEHVGVRHA